MKFQLAKVEHDRDTERAYVELRANDDDGGDMMTELSAGQIKRPGRV
jgi:hypothetical protein